LPWSALDRRRERLYGAATIPGNVKAADVISMSPARRDDLPSDALLFTVPRALVRILDGDLSLAGIAKRGERSTCALTTGQRNRGDWTRLELFLAGVRGWQVTLRRSLDVD
jgi:hypothetical protein